MSRIALLLAVAVAVACSSPSPRPRPGPTTDLSQPAPVKPEPEEATGDRPAAMEAMDEGMEAFNQGAMDAAVVALRRATRLDPTLAQAHYNLGVVLMAQRAYDDAREPLATAVRLAPDDALMRMRHGEVLVRLGQHGAAIAELERAIAQYPKLYRGHELLGEARLATGDHMAAAKAWSQACALAPERGLSYLSLARLYDRWRARAAALAVLEVGARSVTDAAESSEIYLDLGVQLQLAGRRPEAIAAWTAAIDNGALWEAQLQRGMAYAEAGDYARARSDLEAVARLDVATPFARQANQRLVAIARKGKGKRLQVPKAPTLAATAVPPVPNLTLPPATGDALSVLRVQVERDKLLDTEITVRGTVVWIYDCAAAQRKPGESARQVRRRLADQPELCSRPNLYLGDNPGDRTADALWIVEVPRPIRPDERKHLSPEEIKSWPAVPRVKVGDRVAITGTFALRSPRGFANTEGLLVFKSLAPVK